MSPALAQQFRSKHTSGVVITRVDPMGPAPQALTGMQVEKVNGHEIRSVRDLQALASGLKPGSAVSIIGRANEGEQTIINYRLRR